MMNSEPFFRYARERYKIFLAKTAGDPKPWTTDPALQQFRFCNIFREDDKTTAWFRDNYRQAHRFDINIVLATIIFRWFNKIETGDILVRNGLLDEWNSTKAKQLLRSQDTIFTGAYIINSPPGMSKLDGICQNIDRLIAKKEKELTPLIFEMLDQPNTQSMQKMHKTLTSFERLGPFMAYEVVTDLRYTDVLHRAKDRFTWANPGPGALRGICRLNGKPLDFWSRYSKAHAGLLQDSMQQLLTESQDPNNWPRLWPEWEMREVEHTLCEFDKWERVHKGEGRMKQTYNGL